MNNNTYVLRIEVSGVDDSSGGGGKESGGTVSPGVTSDNGIKTLAKRVAKFYSNTQLVRQIANNVVGEISAYSGNARYQARVETGIGLAEKALSTGIAFAIHPMVGLASVASSLVDLGFEMRSNNFNRELEKMQIAQLQQRANIYNRSR